MPKKNSKNEEEGDKLFGKGISRREESLPYELSSFRHTIVLHLGDRILGDV